MTHVTHVALASVDRVSSVIVSWDAPQVIVSAFHLAIRGGLLCSRSLLRWAQSRQMLSMKEEDTYADEIVGAVIAAVGFYTQLSFGFAMPFPLSIFMLPFDGIEWYIRYTITSAPA